MATSRWSDPEAFERDLSGCEFVARDGLALVEQLLERVGRQRLDELLPLLSEDYEIVEP